MLRINDLIEQTVAFAAEHSRLLMNVVSLAEVDQLTLQTTSLFVFCMAALCTRADPIENQPGHPGQ